MCGFFMEHRRANHLKTKVSQAASLPRDVVYQVPIVSLVGDEELTIENYRGIIEYENTIIRIQTKTGLLKINGTALNIEYYTNDEMKISGKIICIEYCK